MALCDLSNASEETSTQLTNLMKNLQKHIDLNDGKVAQLNYKLHLIKKSYGRVWKLLLKQIEDKSASQQQDFDNKLLQVRTSSSSPLFTFLSRCSSTKQWI